MHFFTKMWVSLIIALDFLIAWYVTHWMLYPLEGWISLAREWLIYLHCPSDLIPILLLLPNILLCAVYYMLPKLPKSDTFKSWSGWAYFRRNFKVVGADQPAKTQVIYAICPHGMHGEATIIYFVLNAVYRHVVPVATSLLFYIPIVRELASLGGARPANSADISNLLDDGKSILLLPEGLRSVLYEAQDLRVLKGLTNGESQPRKGFIRLARTSKNHQTLKIVPVWMEGVSDMYTVFRPCVWLQKLLLKTYRYPWPILDYGVGFLPRTDKPVTVYFGKPIMVGSREVDDIFQEFVDSMESLRSKGLAGSQSNG